MNTTQTGRDVFLTSGNHLGVVGHRKLSRRHPGTPRAPEPPSMPFLRLHIEWLQLRRLSDTYVTARRLALKRIARHLGCDPLSARPEQLRDWQRDRQVCTRTLYTELTHVIQYVRWAAGQNLLDHDPTALLVVPKLPRRVPRPAPDDALRAAITSAPKDIRAMLVLAAYEGCRAVELARLDRADVLDTADPPVLIVHGKGDKERLLPLAPAVLDELRRYGMPKQGPVFPRRDGQVGHNTATRISNIVSEYLHDQHLPMTLHQCRHRFATDAYRASHDLRLVQELLGHANPATTAGYAAFAPADAVTVVDRLAHGLAGSPYACIRRS